MSTLLWLLITMAACAVSFAYFMGRSGDTIPAPLSWIFAGLPALSVAVFLQALRLAPALYRRYLGPMLRAGQIKPRDGQRVAFFGTIEPAHSDELLTSPLTRQPCVAYYYEVGNLGSGIDITPWIYDEDSLQRFGFALTPSVVRYGGGRAPLLAWPRLQGFWSRHYSFLPSDNSEVGRNAAAYFNTTSAEEVGILGLRGPIRQAIESLTRNDGRIKHDFRLRGFRVLPRPLTYAEWVVRPGDNVTLVGTWSASHAGVVPDVKGGGSTSIEVAVVPWLGSSAVKWRKWALRLSSCSGPIFLHSF